MIDAVDLVDLKSKNFLLEKWLLPYEVGSSPEHWKSQKQLTEVKHQLCSNMIRLKHIKALISQKTFFSLSFSYREAQYRHLKSQEDRN